jgi:hypothetical protein
LHARLRAHHVAVRQQQLRRLGSAREAGHTLGHICESAGTACPLLSA